MSTRSTWRLTWWICRCLWQLPASQAHSTWIIHTGDGESHMLNNECSRLVQCTNLHSGLTANAFHSKPLECCGDQVDWRTNLNNQTIWQRQTFASILLHSNNIKLIATHLIICSHSAIACGKENLVWLSVAPNRTREGRKVTSSSAPYHAGPRARHFDKQEVYRMLAMTFSYLVHAEWAS